MTSSFHHIAYNLIDLYLSRIVVSSYIWHHCLVLYMAQLSHFIILTTLSHLIMAPLSHLILIWHHYLILFLYGIRGVIWGGWGPLPPPKEKEKKKKKRKKEKRETKREKKKERKKGTMNNVKLLHIKCCFFSNFSIVRWHWKILKKFAPPKKMLKWGSCMASLSHLIWHQCLILFLYDIIGPGNV